MTEQGNDFEQLLFAEHRERYKEVKCKTQQYIRTLIKMINYMECWITMINYMWLFVKWVAQIIARGMWRKYSQWGENIVGWNRTQEGIPGIIYLKCELDNINLSHPTENPFSESWFSSPTSVASSLRLSFSRTWCFSHTENWSLFLEYLLCILQRFNLCFLSAWDITKFLLPCKFH